MNVYKCWKSSWIHAASVRIISWDKLGVNPSPFYVSTRLRLSLAVVARGVHVAACSTAFRSTTEEINSGGHVDGT